MGKNFPSTNPSASATARLVGTPPAPVPRLAPSSNSIHLSRRRASSSRRLDAVSLRLSFREVGYRRQTLGLAGLTPLILEISHRPIRVLAVVVSAASFQIRTETERSREGEACGWPTFAQEQPLTVSLCSRPCFASQPCSKPQKWLRNGSVTFFSVILLDG